MTKGGEGDLSALTFTTKLNIGLSINYFVVYDFGYALFDVIHSAYPFYLVGDFQFLCNALRHLILHYKIIEHFLCLRVYLEEIGIEFAFDT